MTQHWHSVTSTVWMRLGEKLTAIENPIECSIWELLPIQDGLQQENKLIQVAGFAWKYGRVAGDCWKVRSQVAQVKLGVLLQSLMTDIVAARKNRW